MVRLRSTVAHGTNDQLVQVFRLRNFITCTRLHFLAVGVEIFLARRLVHVAFNQVSEVLNDEDAHIFRAVPQQMHHEVCDYGLHASGHVCIRLVYFLDTCVRGGEGVVRVPQLEKEGEIRRES